MQEKKDPIERTITFKKIKKELEKKINEQLISEGYPIKPEFMGWCYIYWSIKKEILKIDYGIDWKTPAEMNPEIIYD